jgi:8-oxo-dGTP pyrophosphatase MutT (NUDIX family)
MATGVAVLPFVEGKVGLMRIWRHPVRSFQWETPRGFIEPRESPQTAALRELREETGLICSPKKIHSLGAIAPEAGAFQARVHLFCARDCKKTGIMQREFGHGSLKYFTLRQARQMALSGRIEDPATLACILKSL